MIYLWFNLVDYKKRGKRKIDDYSINCTKVADKVLMCWVVHIFVHFQQINTFDLLMCCADSADHEKIKKTAVYFLTHSAHQHIGCAEKVHDVQHCTFLTHRVCKCAQKAVKMCKMCNFVHIFVNTSCTLLNTCSAHSNTSTDHFLTHSQI